MRLRFFADQLPLLEGAYQAVQDGFVTRGDRINREYLRGQESIEAGLDPALLSLMLDPQTSGGLLLFVRPDVVDELKEQLTLHGALSAQTVGEAVAGPVGVEVVGTRP